MSMLQGEKQMRNKRSKEIAAARRRQGKCPGCGVQCFEIVAPPEGGPKCAKGAHDGAVDRWPLTKPGTVEHGRCLACTGFLRESLNCRSPEKGSDEGKEIPMNPSLLLREPGARNSRNGTTASYEPNEDKVIEDLGNCRIEKDLGPPCRGVRRSGSLMLRSIAATKGRDDSFADLSDIDTSVGGPLSSSIPVTMESSPIGLVVNECAKELQSIPPLRERRTFLVLHSVYNFIVQSEENKELAVQHGIIPAVTSAMANHRYSSRVQAKACSIIASLVEQNGEHREFISFHAGVSNILACMMANMKGEKLVQQEACKALYLITLTPRNASQLAYSRGVRVLNKIIKTYVHEPLVLYPAFAVIHNVSRVEHRIVAEPEIIEDMVAVLMKQKKSKEVLRTGCLVFHSLALDGTQTTRNALVWANVVTCLLCCIKRNIVYEGVVIHTLETLHVLSEARPEARCSIADDGLPLLLEVMKRYEKNALIQREVCDLLCIVTEWTKSSSVAKVLQKNRGVLETAAITFPSHCGALVQQTLMHC